MATVIALLTILAPILSVLVVAWADKIKTARQEQPYDDIDAHITQHLGGNQAGLVNLSRDLERLHTKAQRRRHS